MVQSELPPACIRRDVTNTTAAATPAPANPPPQQNSILQSSEVACQQVIDLTNSEDESARPRPATPLVERPSRRNLSPRPSSVPGCSADKDNACVSRVSSDTSPARPESLAKDKTVESAKCEDPVDQPSRLAEEVHSVGVSSTVPPEDVLASTDKEAKQAESMRPSSCVEAKEGNRDEKSAQVPTGNPSTKQNPKIEGADTEIEFVSHVRQEYSAPSDVTAWRERLVADSSEAYDKLSSAKGDAVSYTSQFYFNNNAIDVLMRAALRIGARSVARLATPHEQKAYRTGSPEGTEGCEGRPRCVVMSLSVGELAQLTKPALQRLVARSVDEIFSGRSFKLSETIAITDDSISPPQRLNDARHNFRNEPNHRDRNAPHTNPNGIEHPHHAIAKRRRDARHEAAVRHWMKHNDNGNRGRRYGAGGRYNGRYNRNQHGGQGGGRKSKKYLARTLSPAMQKEQDALAEYFRQDTSHIRDPVATAASADMSVEGQRADAIARERALAASAIWDGKGGRRGEGSGAVTAPALNKQTSRGYTLLERMGWREGTGLGTSGQGRVAPIEARVRDYRAGVGL